MFKYLLKQQKLCVNYVTLCNSNSSLLNLNKCKFSFSHSAKSRNPPPKIDEELEDEIAIINQLIINPHTTKIKPQTGKASFKLDVNKDMKKYFESKLNKNKIKDDDDENSIIRKKLKKLSEAEQVTIRKDEDVSKYNLVIQSEQDTEAILDSVFKKGVNAKFVNKLDMIYEKVKEEELDEWERIGKSSNVYGLQLEEKDLSDIEEEIENMMKDKIEGQGERKIKTIEEYISTRNKEVKEKKRSTEQSIEKKAGTEQSIDKKAGTEQSIEKRASAEESKEKKASTEQSIDKKEKIIKTEDAKNLNYSALLNPTGKEDKNIPILIPPITPSISLTETTSKATRKKAPPKKTSSIPKQTPSPTPKPQKIRPSPSKDYFKSFPTPTPKETFVQPKSVNLKYETIFNLFEQLSDNLYDKTEIINNKDKKVYIIRKQFKKTNLQKFLVDNYQIKTFGDRFSTRLFKTFLFDINRSRFEMITSRILNTEASTINIVYNSKRSAATKEGYAVFMIFAEDELVGNILLNMGQIQNVKLTNYISSFFSLIIVELIQACCQKSKRLLHFNLIFAKKFELEAKLTMGTKTPLILILNNLIEGKLSKFKKNELRITESYNKTDLDEVFDEVGNSKSLSQVSKIPNLKFYYYAGIYMKYFNQFFHTAAKLDAGNLCFKI